MQNGYIESFNGKFRNEYLNEHWFLTLPQARSEIGSWRQDYNEVRLHSSLEHIPAPGTEVPQRALAFVPRSYLGPGEKLCRLRAALTAAR